MNLSMSSNTTHIYTANKYFNDLIHSLFVFSLTARPKQYVP